MNSKESLNNIKNLFIGSSINPTQQFEIIEKDLEVLDILKSNVVSLNMIAIFETCKGYNDWAKEYHRYSSLLTEEDFNKIKEWLNDK